jgi:hypothetical protein
MIMHLFRTTKYAIYCIGQKKFLSAATGFDRGVNAALRRM